MLRPLLLLLLLLLLIVLDSVEALPDSTLEALVEIAWQPERERIYIGSPSIVKCPNRDIIVASHDYFGDIESQRANHVFIEDVFNSADGGKTWSRVGRAHGVYWATLFAYGDSIYLLGTGGDNLKEDEGFPGVRIVSSIDCGATWTQPVTLFSPLATERTRAWHSGPTPVLVQNGFLYKGMELWDEHVDPATGHNEFSLIIISAHEDCIVSKGMMDASCWNHSSDISFDQEWIPSSWKITGNMQWQEANVVQSPDGNGIVMVARMDNQNGNGFNKAAYLRYEEKSNSIQFDHFIDFPSSSSKFSIKRSKSDGLYYSLTDPVIGPVPHVDSQRNVMVLAVSMDLQKWSICGPHVLYDDTGLSWEESLRLTGFQYADWQFEGEDIIAVVRLAYRGSGTYHNANRLGFLRISEYSKRCAEKDLRDFGNLCEDDDHICPWQIPKNAVICSGRYAPAHMSLVYQ